MTPLADPSPAPSSLLTRVAVGISIAVHVGAVLLSLAYAGAGLFAPSEVEAVQVSLVTPEELPPPPQPETKPEPDMSQLDLRLTPAETKSETKPPSSAQQASAQQVPAQQASMPQASSQQAPAPSSQSAQQTKSAQQPSQPQQTQAPAAQAYAQPQPDISMKYRVDLGLKMLPPAPTQMASAQDGTSDFDAPAMKTAEVDRGSIAAFRAKLKQCAALPAQISPDDKVVIVLRATFTPDAKLAAAPVLIEASASAKGPALMQAAIGALQDCQPHNALPADKYAEWRVLDLRFTPQDFRRG